MSQAALATLGSPPALGSHSPYELQTTWVSGCDFHRMRSHHEGTLILI